MKNQEEEKKSFKRRLSLLVLLLLITGVMLSVSTYAWFTANENVSVSQIQVTAATSTGIQISADGTTWKTILQTSDLTGAKVGKYANAVNQIPTSTDEISPVSTIKSATNGRLNMYLGDVISNAGGQQILTAQVAGERDNNDTTTSVTNPGKFVAFDIFLKINLTSGTQQVYLTPDSGITSADTTDKGIKNASRVAFINLGNTTSTQLTEIQALGSSVSGSDPVTIWEPNYDVHTAEGVQNATDTYGLTGVNQAGNSAPLAYSGVKATIADSDNVLLGSANATNYSSKFANVTVDKSTTAAWTGGADSQNMEIFQLSNGITKFRVYMWVEGQDVDCENNASGGKINFDLQFTIHENE